MKKQIEILRAAAVLVMEATESHDRSFYSCNVIELASIDRGGYVDELCYALKKGYCRFIIEVHLHDEYAAWCTNHHDSYHNYALSVRDGYVYACFFSEAFGSESQAARRDALLAYADHLEK